MKEICYNYSSLILKKHYLQKLMPKEWEDKSQTGRKSFVKVTCDKGLKTYKEPHKIQQ